MHSPLHRATGAAGYHEQAAGHDNGVLAAKVSCHAASTAAPCRRVPPVGHDRAATRRPLRRPWADYESRAVALDRNELGALLVAAGLGPPGDAAGARDQFAALLPIMERVIDAEHPGTLTTRGDLANWTGEAGDPAGARDEFAALLPVRERVLGAEHPDTLWARADLASWTGQAGIRPGPATGTPRCCQSASGCWAPSTRTPWPPPPQPRRLDRAGRDGI